jgi:hypothetical protein
MKLSYRYTAAATMVCLLISFGTMRATTGSYVPAYAQLQSNWCWAACGQMIYWAYKPGSIAQCDFVAVSRDKENSEWFDCNNLSSSTASPCSSPGTFNSPQSLYTCGGSIENVLDHYGISSTGYGNAFSTGDLTTATSNRRHCVARWGWNSGGGHFVVIYRYSGGNVSFNNPIGGSSYTWAYNTFKTANGAGNWTHTLRMDGSAVYGSVYAREANPDDKAVISEVNVDFNFYPNPASAQVNLILPQASGGNHVIVSNMMGQAVHNIRYDASQSSAKLDVSSWPKGVYFIQVNDSPAKKLVIE